MNKKELNELLDSVYELEGLVHLAINRDDSPSALPELIRRKAVELKERACLATDSTQSVSPQPEIYEEYVPAQTRLAEQQIITERPVAIEEPVAVEPPVTVAQPIIAEPPVAVAQTVISEPSVATAQAVIPESPVMAQEPVNVREPQMVREPVIRQTQVGVETPVLSQPPMIEDETIYGSHYAPAPAAYSPAAEPKGKLVFSINDRYRFKRELFDSSDAAFNRTLSFVASMDNFDEAEGYFIDELGWDLQNPTVADFLEILKKYFKA